MSWMQQTVLVGPPRTGTGAVVPPLKWAGGKRWLVPHLQALWKNQRQRRLVEPFAGGLAITLGLLPEQALLNDINPHLINFYRHLQQGIVQRIPGNNDEETYYWNRTKFNGLIRKGRAHGGNLDQYTRRAAQLFYYLNRHCYNGLCRFNKDGEFNTPTGRYRNPKYEKDLRSYQPIVSGWNFISVDFRKVPLRPNDFVVADPPYDDAFTGYSEHGFGWAEQQAVARWLSEHDGPVVVTNHATDRILECYASYGFDVTKREPAPRMIHCKGDRTPAMEVIATKNL